jgi:hypothetical protein
MKTFKWLIIIVIPMFFVATLISHPWSAQQKVTIQKSQQKPPTTVPPSMLKCPNGWHKKPGSTYPHIVCVPDKPTPIQCPEGTEYYECLTPGKCCEVGCRVPPPR